MSDGSTEGVPRHPLLELLARVQGMSWALRQLSREVPRLDHYTSRWVLCFHGDGTLAGIVDAGSWAQAGSPVLRLGDLRIARQSGLVQAELVPAESCFDMGDTYDGIVWDLRAARQGVRLPCLARPLNTGSDAFDEASHTAQEYREAAVYGELSTEDASLEALSGRLAAAVVEASHLHDLIEGGLQYVGFVTSHVEAAEAAAQQLPPSVLQALDGLDGAGWRARFRRNLLAAVSRWPTDATESGEPLPEHAEELMRLISESQPIEHWQILLKTIDRFATDLRAASSEITTDEPRTAYPAATLPTAGDEAPAAEVVDPGRDEAKGGEWSRIMTKTEAGRLLGCPDDDRACRNWVDEAIADCSGVMLKLSPKRYKFDMAWIAAEYPSLVNDFRL